MTKHDKHVMHEFGDTLLFWLHQAVRDFARDDTRQCVESLRKLEAGAGDLAKVVREGRPEPGYRPLVPLVRR